MIKKKKGKKKNKHKKGKILKKTETQKKWLKRRKK
jgi:hypothetical protein